MRSAELGKVGKKIREIRKRRKMNLQEVAERSDITAGLLSRIENFKTLPSLPVLHKISIALEVPLSELVQPVGPPKPTDYLLIKNGSAYQEQDDKGWVSRQLFNTGFADTNLQVQMLSIPPQTHQKQNTIDQMELIFMIKGKMYFHLREEKVPVEQGDTFYIDSKSLVALENPSEFEAHLFKVLLSKI